MKKPRRAMLTAALAAVLMTGGVFTAVNASADDYIDGTGCELRGVGDPVAIDGVDLSVQVNFYTLCQLPSGVSLRAELVGAGSDVDPFSYNQMDAALDAMETQAEFELYYLGARGGGEKVCGDLDVASVEHVGNGATDLGPALSEAFRDAVRSGATDLGLVFSC